MVKVASKRNKKNLHEVNLSIYKIKITGPHKFRRYTHALHLKTKWDL